VSALLTRYFGSGIIDVSKLQRSSGMRISNDPEKRLANYSRIFPELLVKEGSLPPMST
jgi:hypothetical protein